MKIKRRVEMAANIPTASMSDIAFLLILFFMVTSTFRKGGGLKIILPTARTTERLGKQKDLAYLWINREGKMAVDDNVVPDPSRLALIFKTKMADNPALITIIKADASVKYGSIDDAMEALKTAGALRVVFATQPEEEGTRP